MRVRSYAPLRILDIGGWTDTKMAENGCVVNFAVDPGIEVEISDSDEDRYIIGDVTLNGPQMMALYPLIVNIRNQYDKDKFIEIVVLSHVTAGSGMGTSGALCVALIGALNEYYGVDEGRKEIIKKAHYIETEISKLNSGIQDYVSAAYGCVNRTYYENGKLLGIHGETLKYENVVDNIVVLGYKKPHNSSDLHEVVYNNGQNNSMMLKHCMNYLYTIATNFRGNNIAASMGENQYYQCKLLDFAPEIPELTECSRLGYILGYKQNGAGGFRQGTISVLCDGLKAKTHFTELVKGHNVNGCDAALEKTFKVIPVKLNTTGLRVWRTGE